RRRIEVEVIFLDVLPVIPLAVGQPEQPLLQNGIATIPHGEREAQQLPVVGYARQAVLAPAIGPGARMVMAEVIPGVAVLAVVFAPRPPLAFAEIGAPLLPGHRALAHRREARHFGGDRRRLGIGWHGWDSIPPLSRAKATRHAEPTFPS